MLAGTADGNERCGVHLGWAHAAESVSTNPWVLECIRDPFPGSTGGILWDVLLSGLLVLNATRPSSMAVSKGPPGEKQMTMDAGGNTVVAWTERDGLGSRVMVTTN